MHISETLPPSTMYPWPLVSSISPGVSPTSFKDWEKIDREEQRVGQERSKPREKVLSVERMMEIVQEGRWPSDCLACSINYCLKVQLVKLVCIAQVMKIITVLHGVYFCNNITYSACLDDESMHAQNTLLINPSTMLLVHRRRSRSGWFGFGWTTFLVI